MNFFFTSDTHFSHANILRYCNRPFASVHEHDETLIANWNSVVTKNDIVYHLGDFCLGSVDRAVEILKRLNFLEFKFVWGNHDKTMLSVSRLANLPRSIQFIGDQRRIRIPTVFKQSQEIVLNHYAMRVWDKSHYGSWQLYGHSHGTLPDDPNALAIDVGVDCHNYRPISFQDIQAIMSQKTWKPVDHHAPKE